MQFLIPDPETGALKAANPTWIPSWGPTHLVHLRADRSRGYVNRHFAETLSLFAFGFACVAFPQFAYAPEDFEVPVVVRRYPMLQMGPHIGEMIIQAPDWAPTVVVERMLTVLLDDLQPLYVASVDELAAWPEPTEFATIRQRFDVSETRLVAENGYGPNIAPLRRGEPQGGL